nr:threonine synthase [Kordiimonas gwangyangensis]
MHGLSRAGRPLLVRYDLDRIRDSVSRDEVWSRGGGFWKWRELLPVTKTENVIALGEDDTPLISCTTLAHDLGVSGEIIIKDEGRLPTGSFKARGLALAVSMAKEFGIKRLAMPTNGNAGAAMAAYATRAGMESYIFCPDDTPDANVREIALQGGKVWRVNGLINDCGKIVGEGKEAMGWFDLSTLKEPYRIEGKKTMGLELAAQLGWDVPDVIFYPTGGGTGLIGMWKAFHEMEALGWIGSKRPRMVAVQATGCAPIVKAYEDGERHATLWQGAHTFASGIRVPVAVGDFLILDAVRESGGFAIAVDDDKIENARREIGAREGVLVCPEGAATYAAYKEALKDGRVGAGDRVVLFNCGNGLKYEMPEMAGRLNRNEPINYEDLKK